MSSDSAHILSVGERAEGGVGWGGFEWGEVQPTLVSRPISPRLCGGRADRVGSPPWDSSTATTAPDTCKEVKRPPRARAVPQRRLLVMHLVHGSGLDNRYLGRPSLAEATEAAPSPATAPAVRAAPGSRAGAAPTGPTVGGPGPYPACVLLRKAQDTRRGAAAQWPPRRGSESSMPVIRRSTPRRRGRNSGSCFEPGRAARAGPPAVRQRV